MSIATVERTAGAALIRSAGGNVELLVIRRRARVHELPKGHVEMGETERDAAWRELVEETGLLTPAVAGPDLGVLAYRFDGPPEVHKQLRVFLFVPESDPQFAALPAGTRALRWIRAPDVDELPLRSENLRPLLRSAFERYAELKGVRAEAAARC